MQPNDSSEAPSLNRKLLWLALLLMMIATLALVIMPVLIIPPSEGQTPEQVKLAYTLRHWSPMATLLLTLFGFGAALQLWRGKASWWRRSMLILLLLPMLAGVFASRYSPYTLAFKPLPNPEFIGNDQVDFVEDHEMMLAVEINGEAAAYPLRQVGFHHVINDVVGDTPIAVTY